MLKASFWTYYVCVCVLEVNFTNVYICKFVKLTSKILSYTNFRKAKLIMLCKYIAIGQNLPFLQNSYVFLDCSSNIFYRDY